MRKYKFSEENLLSYFFAILKKVAGVVQITTGNEKCTNKWTKSHKMRNKSNLFESLGLLVHQFFL